MLSFTLIVRYDNFCFKSGNDVINAGTVFLLFVICTGHHRPWPSARSWSVMNGVPLTFIGTFWQTPVRHRNGVWLLTARAYHLKLLPQQFIAFQTISLPFPSRLFFTSRRARAVSSKNPDFYRLKKGLYPFHDQPKCRWKCTTSRHVPTLHPFSIYGLNNNWIPRLYEICKKAGKHSSSVVELENILVNLGVTSWGLEGSNYGMWVGLPIW